LGAVYYLVKQRLRLQILDADHSEQDGATVRLWCKDPKGKTVLVLDRSFVPYFYVHVQDGKAEDLKNKLRAELKRHPDLTVLKTETAKKKIAGDERTVLKIWCGAPSDLSKVRDVVKIWEPSPVIEEYEYALTHYKRYLIEKGLSGMDWIEVEGEDIPAPGLKVDLAIDAEKITRVEDENLSDAPAKVLAFDIESVEEAGQNKIIMISLSTEKTKKVLTYQEDEHYGKYVEVLKDEKELLERFAEIVNEQDPDIILGYNSDLFDFPVISDRAEKLKVPLALSRDGSKLKFARRARWSAARLKGRVHVDLFEFVNNILSQTLQTEVMSLDAVSAELLGDKKIEFEFEEILEAWRKKKDLAKLAEYAMKDSELTLRLAHLILPQIFELSRVVGQLPFDTSRMTSGQDVEWYLSRRAFELGEVIPNQPKHEDIIARRALQPIVGAFVREPIAGVHESIAVMDFRSLYPSIIASFNISPETLKCEHAECAREKVPEVGHWYCKKKRGLVSRVIEELIEKRAQLKKKLKSLKPGSLEHRKLDNEQFALKLIANTTYGHFGFAGAKWYCRECAESATAYGRYFIKQVMAWAEAAGFVVVYGDSDSMFVKLKEENSSSASLEKAVDKFITETNEKLPGIMELDLQGYYVRGIFIPRGVGPGTAKKRYALIDQKGNLTIRGLERVRRDWSDVARDTQEEVLRLVLKKKDVEGAVRYVRQVLEDLRKGKIPLRQLTIYEQLTKPLSEYRAIGPHVIAARKIKERGRPLGVGMVIMFAITKGKGSISQRAEPVEDIGLEDVDVDYYTHNQIIPAAMRVLAVLGVTEDELLGKPKQHGLLKFADKKQSGFLFSLS